MRSAPLATRLFLRRAPPPAASLPTLPRVAVPAPPPAPAETRVAIVRRCRAGLALAGASQALVGAARRLATAESDTAARVALDVVHDRLASVRSTAHELGALYADLEPAESAEAQVRRIDGARK